MLKIATKTKLSPEEAIKQAVQFFGPGGYGLEVKAQSDYCTYLEGGGVEVTTCAEEKGTSVELVSRDRIVAVHVRHQPGQMLDFGLIGNRGGVVARGVQHDLGVGVERVGGDERPVQGQVGDGPGLGFGEPALGVLIYKVISVVVDAVHGVLVDVVPVVIFLDNTRPNLPLFEAVTVIVIVIRRTPVCPALGISAVLGLAGA